MGASAVTETLFLVGIGCIIAAIVGGGLKAFGVEFGPLASVTRQALLFALGVVLVVGAYILPPLPPNNGGSDGATPSPQPTASAPTPSLPATAGSTEGPTPTPTAPPTPAPTPRPLSAREQIAGTWHLDRWVEAAGPITLYIDLSDGTLDLGSAGEATWTMSIRERGEDPHPVPGLTCVGEVPLQAGSVNGIPGGNEKDWTGDLTSIRADLLLALCGWYFDGQTAPFTLAHDGAVDHAATNLEMSNSKGKYVWSR
jgi:hypothetical protein